MSEDKLESAKGSFQDAVLNSRPKNDAFAAAVGDLERELGRLCASEAEFLHGIGFGCTKESGALKLIRGKTIEPMLTLTLAQGLKEGQLVLRSEGREIEETWDFVYSGGSAVWRSTDTSDQIQSTGGFSRLIFTRLLEAGAAMVRKDP